MYMDFHHNLPETLFLLSLENFPRNFDEQRATMYFSLCETLLDYFSDLPFLQIQVILRILPWGFKTTNGIIC